MRVTVLSGPPRGRRRRVPHRSASARRARPGGELRHPARVQNRLLGHAQDVESHRGQGRRGLRHVFPEQRRRHRSDHAQARLADAVHVQPRSERTAEHAEHERVLRQDVRGRAGGSRIRRDARREKEPPAAHLVRVLVVRRARHRSHRRRHQAVPRDAPGDQGREGSQEGQEEVTGREDRQGRQEEAAARGRHERAREGGRRGVRRETRDARGYAKTRSARHRTRF
mmetsp:Transcript_5926/g.25196  ORF Transcript_5926/g.25196 Transcript_5926/m.25196 type:complete len:226 (+) Transcript_5926:165-842(+)